MRLSALLVPSLVGLVTLLPEPLFAASRNRSGKVNKCQRYATQALNSLACADPTAGRFLDRIKSAVRTLEAQVSIGARPAVRAHQQRWEQYVDAWFATTSKNSRQMRCAAPRAMLFQRVDALDKAIASLRATRPKTIDICYDNGACLEPGAVNTEMVCETLFLGMDGVPADAEPIIVDLLGKWTSDVRPFETRITKSTANNETCEIVSETALVEYLRGGFVTVRYRMGDTCQPQSGSEQLVTFDLRSGKPLTIGDFTTTPQALLAVLKNSKQTDVLQALLRTQLKVPGQKPAIEPSECETLPFATLKNVAVHVTNDGLRFKRYFKKPPRELLPCQFKVEEGIPPSLMAQLLRAKKNSPASGMLRYIK